MPLVEVRALTKDYPGVRALSEVTLGVDAGEVLALAGENGAGKSTLIRCLAGEVPYGDYQGEIRLDGAPARFAGPIEARRRGIAVVHQELSLVDDLTVAENLLLGDEPRRGPFLDPIATRRRARGLLAHLGLELDPSARVADLPVGKRQLVEIARALRSEARVLVLDEPTSALTDPEVETLFAIVADLKRGGVGVLFVSHRLAEVLRIADRVAVLKDGALVAIHPASALERARLVALMVGRPASGPRARRAREPGEVALEVRHLRLPPGDVGRPLEGVSLGVRRGEIVALAGLMGSGRSEVLHAIFGAFGDRAAFELFVGGRPVAVRRPKDAIDAGMALVTEDRKLLSLHLGMAVRENLSLAALARMSAGPFVRRRVEAARARELSQRLEVKAPSLEAPVATLSGGNQQKVVFGKWLATAASVLLLDEPTRGIDVGAKEEMHRLIRALADQGAAVLVVSSELPELLALADRVVVMREGRVAGELAAAQATEESVMRLATGTRG